MHEHMYIDMYAHTCIEIYINLLDYTHTYSKRLIKIMSVHILQKFLSTFVKVFNNRLHFYKKEYNAKSPTALVWSHSPSVESDSAVASASPRSPHVTSSIIRRRLLLQIEGLSLKKHHRRLSKEDMWMAKGHVTRCSTSVIIREMQIKTDQNGHSLKVYK